MDVQRANRPAQPPCEPPRHSNPRPSKHAVHPALIPPRNDRATSLKRVERVVALDYGSARCGVAVSDPTGTLATPLDAITRPNTRKGFNRLLAAIRALEPARVVVGLPLSLSG